ncbi:MAG TPA: hypothetical protein DHW63_03795 [Hyphomonadaceae bacterium]|nr:hypothetical protein [Hyphomonadaceae bacterium]
MQTRRRSQVGARTSWCAREPAGSLFPAEKRAHREVRAPTWIGWRARQTPDNALAFPGSLLISNPAKAGLSAEARIASEGGRAGRAWRVSSIG